ncbi:MAG TPA: hypothetical protein PKC99_12695 [Anaerolineales bacterium]|nr:hypothetical protein [Anaerolineales bacterium]
MKDELVTKLAEVRKSMKNFIGRELSEDETEKLDGLNKQASKLTAQIEALEQIDLADAENKTRIEREKREAVEAAVKAERAKANRVDYSEAPYATKFADTNRFDNLDAAETALVIDVLNSQNKPVSGAAVKALSLKIGELKDDNTREGQKSVNYVKNAFKAATRIDPTPEATANAVKAATDPMYTGGSNIGAEWIGTAYSSEIWRAIRAGNVVIDRVPSDVIPDGYSSKYWPLEGADPTWYKVAEATASDATLKVPAATVAASQMGTDRKQISVGKLGARSLYTQELSEDSLIGFAPQLREQLVASGQEILEHIVIDGDVDTRNTTNINDIGGQPAGTEPFLLFDGFRKLALVTNTANSRSASGGFVVSDFKDTLKLLGAAGLAGADPTKVAFIVDYNTMWAALDLPEIKTRDVFGMATIENGMLKRIYNTEVLSAFQMHRYAPAAYARKANSAGKVDQDTASNNLYGSILAVRFDQWKQAYKRRMTIETTRIANADSWEIVALVRWGLAYRDNEASAITYGVGV